MKKLIFCMLILALAGCGGTVSPTAEPTVTQQNPLVYYAFTQGDVPTRLGSVVIVPDQITLIPVSIPVPHSDDIAKNIETALQAMMIDENNLWASGNLAVEEVTFNEGLATVRLTGEITGTGGAVLSAAGTQILLTVFTDTAVENAIITLNDETIRNLGISNSAEAQPPETVYLRADIARIIEGG